MKTTCCSQDQATPFCAFCGKSLCHSPLDWLEKHLIASIVQCRRGIANAEKELAKKESVPAYDEILRRDGELLQARRKRLTDRLDALDALRDLRKEKDE